MPPIEGFPLKTWKPIVAFIANGNGSTASNRIHPEASRIQASGRIPAIVSMTSRETASSEAAWPAASREWTQ